MNNIDPDIFSPNGFAEHFDMSSEQDSFLGATPLHAEIHDVDGFNSPLQSLTDNSTQLAAGEVATPDGITSDWNSPDNGSPKADFPTFEDIGGPSTSGDSTLGSDDHSISFGRSGDADLDRLLDEADQLRRDIHTDFQTAGGIDGAFERTTAHYSDFRQSIENMKSDIMNMDDDQLRRFANHQAGEARLFEAESHVKEVESDIHDFEMQRAAHQTEAQYRMEQDGYHQLHPYTHVGPHGDPNLFEKDGELFKLDDFGNRYRIDQSGNAYPI